MSLPVGRVAQAGQNVLFVQVREFIEDFLMGHSRRQIVENVMNRYPYPSDAGLPCPFSRLDGNQFSVVHACASTTNQLGTKLTVVLPVLRPILGRPKAFNNALQASFLATIEVPPVTNDRMWKITRFNSTSRSPYRRYLLDLQDMFRVTIVLWWMERLR